MLQQAAAGRNKTAVVPARLHELMLYCTEAGELYGLKTGKATDQNLAIVLDWIGDRSLWGSR